MLKKAPPKSWRKLCMILITASVFVVIFFYYVSKELLLHSTARLVVGISAGLFLCAVLITLGCLLLYKKAQLHRICLIACVCFSVLSCFIQLPGGIPDEPYHYKCAYLWSNVVMGIPVEEAEVKSVYQKRNTLVRAADLELMRELDTREKSYIETYKAGAKDLIHPPEASALALVEGEVMDLGVSPFEYLPAVFGIVFGRLLHIGARITFYLARVFTALTFSVLVSLAVKYAPTAKTAYFCIALFPMSIHLAGSISYDALIIGVTFLTSALLLRAIFCESWRPDKKTILVLAILAALLAPMKNASYLAVLMLLFLIPKSRFQEFPKWKTCLIVLGVAVLVLVLLKIEALLKLFGKTDLFSKEAISLSDLLRSPGYFIKTIFLTTAAQSEFYLWSMIGTQLSWFSIPLPWYIGLGFFVLLVFVCLPEKSELCYYGSRKNRFTILGICALVYLWFLIGMLLWWTKAGAPVIEGVQGRYFLPILPMLCIALRSARFTAADGMGAYLCFGATALSTLAFLYMTASFLSV